MHHYNLGFISDEDIYEHVKKTVESYGCKLRLSLPNEQILDPIKLIFDYKVYGKFTPLQKEKENISVEKDILKVYHVGAFHKNVFKIASKDWRTSNEEFDVLNNKKHIYAFLIERITSLKISTAQKMFIEMQAKLLEDKQATCYLIETLADKSTDAPWEVSIGEKNLTRHNIRKMSIDKFYGLVFGDQLAFFKLCKALPRIIDDVVNDDEELNLKKSVYDNLIATHRDPLTALFLHSFSHYEGFSQLLKYES